MFGNEEMGTTEYPTWESLDGEAARVDELMIEELEAIEPGPFLAIMLATIDVATCSGYDRITVLRAHQRMASHYQAQVASSIASVSDHLEVIDQGDVELAHRGTVAEVRAALRLTRRAAEVEVDFALDLRKRLPQVWRCLLAGKVDIRRAKTIVYGTSHLPRDTARSVANEAVDLAPRLTTGQLAARIRKLCIDVNPTDAAERYDNALDQRRVVLQATETGAAALLALDLPSDRATAAANRINALARRLKSATEQRSMDQLRADVLLDLLEGTGQPHARTKGMVNIHVDLDTLAGLAENSAELNGYGPVIADIARQVTERQMGQRWQYVVADSETGQPLQSGTTRRRPTALQHREVLSLNRTCVTPGCRMPASECDIDHREDFAQGGETATENLDPLCRYDHVNKHILGWTYERLPNGDHLWTTKLGHTYTTSGKPP